MSSGANNNTSCGITDSTTTLVYSTMGGVAILVCSTALIPFLVMKLHRKLVYRLALYQVLSALVYGVIGIVQLVFIDNAIVEDVSRGLCVAIAFIHEYVIILKLMCTIWVTFHIFCYVVLYRNMKRLEMMYVLTSLVVPVFFAVVPFTTETYGLAGSWCWIQTQRKNCPGKDNLLIKGVAEQFALLYAPGMITLLAESVAMVIIVAIVYYRKRQDTLQDNGAIQTKVMRQMLPLAAYPITFCLLFVTPFINRVYDVYSNPPRSLLIASALCIQLWSVAAGLSLWAHIMVIRRESHKIKTAKFLKAEADLHTSLLRRDQSMNVETTV